MPLHGNDSGNLDNDSPVRIVDPNSRGTSGYLGKSGGENEGPFFRFTVLVANGIITSVAFKTYSCLWSQAIGITIAALIEKKSLQDALGISEADVITKVEGIPRGKRPIVALGVKAIHALTQQHSAD